MRFRFSPYLARYVVPLSNQKLLGYLNSLTFNRSFLGRFSDIKRVPPVMFQATTSKIRTGFRQH